jgi:hypothetical protein
MPTSKSGFLPRVFNSLESQLNNITQKPEEATRVQKAVAKLTATVAVAIFSVVDIMVHAVLATLYALPTLVKVTVASWTGLDKHMHAAFDGQEWLSHAFKIYAKAAMIVPALTFVFGNSSTILNVGRDFGLINVVEPKKGAAIAVTSATPAPVTVS